MGERFAGRYELVDHLGEGGGGTVWRAWDHKQARYVATKLLRQRDAAALLRFVREQSMRVAHPHVVAPHGWAAEDDDVLLTMDLVAGGSVATLVADYGRLPLPTVLVLLDQLLDALGAVHAAGLVHRDVKPGNLLLEPTGTGPPFLRLADFGIAVGRNDHRLTVTGTVVGTPGYVAPEVLRTGVADPRQDLWAVAVLARHLLTGVAPGASPGGLPLPAADLPAWPRDLPIALVTLLERMADEDPGRRPSDAAAARAALRSSAPPPVVDVAGVGEPIEVFDHLADLPAGWTSTGPYVVPSVDSATTPAAVPAAVTGTGATAPGADFVTVPRSVPTRSAAPEATGKRRDTAVDRAPSSAAHPARIPPPGPQRSRGRVLQLAAAAVLALLAGVAFAVAVAVDGDEQVPGDPSTPSSATSTAGADQVTAGDDCDFTETGNTAPGVDGVALTCSLRDGRYTWG